MLFAVVRRGIEIQIVLHRKTNRYKWLKMKGETEFNVRETYSFFFPLTEKLAPIAQGMGSITFTFLQA